ncbi:hypothetical protein NA56DRAFT_583378 [Hyaloscypha hepaticicola]|uniref:Heterokaryon incompatibility domain-containing protein n=1 Tax=Hyaloscypha hepaticicola TaxID=2082293 RepID=A0A2J6PKW3_9HELO|nr:hypothetical protein NA56DRAFT_583378 [Hyaloscypha hepaticicola]
MGCSEIRLLKLEPGCWDYEIRCRIEYVLLDNDPASVALSYTWGDLTDTVEISIAGQAFKVTRDLSTNL